jgi:hypothetical protein
LVASGNKTVVTSKEIYFGVVGIETVRTILALTAMDEDLKVVAADIGIAFLYGKNKEKTMIRAGLEFGQQSGKLLIVEGGWYGHKTAAPTFHSHVLAQLRLLRFHPSKADLDLWIRKKDDGSYEYLASYVDDIIVISTDPMSIIEKLRETYILKGVGTPENYLGGNFHQLKDPILNAMHIKTALSVKTYIGNSVEKFERMFEHSMRESKYPMAEGYHPELDDTMLLDDSMSTKYRAIIGSLNWTVILGRFDVMYATNTLARFSMAPRLGHLEAAKRILGHLKK